MNRVKREGSIEQLRARARAVSAHFERAVAEAVERLDAGGAVTDDDLDRIARLEARADAIETLLFVLGGRSE